MTRHVYLAHRPRRRRRPSLRVVLAFLIIWLLAVTAHVWIA